MKIIFLQVLVVLGLSVQTQAILAQRECACNMTGLYLDVAVALDFSNTGGPNSITEAISDVASVFIKSSISQSGGQHSRVALGSFDVDFRLNYTLSYFTSTDAFEYDIWMMAPVQNPTTTVSNLTAALIGLQHELSNKNRFRDNIVSTAMIFTSSYGGDSNTLGVANTMKSFGMKIIINSMYSGNDPSVNQNLARIASPEMLITTKDTNTVGSLEHALCQANCYCPNLYYQYVDTTVDPPDVYGECVDFGTSPVTWHLAVNVCLDQDRYLATAYTKSKINFLAGIAKTMSHFPAPHNFLVGLYNDKGTWKWLQENGSPAVADNNTHWLPGYPTNQNNTDCAEIAPADATEQTFGLKDLNSFQDQRMYVCEIIACDSSNYC